MKQIERIYVNEFGVAFFWKRHETLISRKIQLVFKETGFYFSLEELQHFKALIDESCLQNQSCDSCKMKDQCQKFLLRTPVSQIELAVTMNELNGIKDLVQGTLFKIDLQWYVFGVGRN